MEVLELLKTLPADRTYLQKIELQEGRAVLERSPYRVVFEKLAPEVWRVQVEKDGDALSSRILILPLSAYQVYEIPAYLELPVLLVFRSPVTVGPLQKTQVYAHLPLQLEIRAQKGEEVLPVERLHPLNLKYAWFGPPHQGSLCYFYETEVSPSVEEAELGSFETLVPIEVENTDKEPRELTRVMIDSYQLSIYYYKDRLVSERVRVRIDDESVEVHYLDEPPGEGAVEIVRGALTVKEKGLAKFSVRKLGKITAMIFHSPGGVG